MPETPAERRARWLSVSISPSATPSRGQGQEAVRIIETERRWDTDGAAYKRLRRDGLQPPGIDGCAALETAANHPKEIEMGRTLHPEALNIASDAGII
jgi:hypothetical protein